MTLFVALGGCTEGNDFYQPGPLLSDECRRGVEVSERFESFESPEKLDILAVIDNSSDMKRAQKAFADALPAFLETLDEREISVRLGVLSTDADAPIGLSSPGTEREGCAQNTGDVADSQSDGDWTRVAACNVVRTDASTPRQQAFGVLQKNLVEQPEALSDFLRPRARKLILILSNEDDCSSENALGQANSSVRERCATKADQLDEIAAWVESVRAQSVTEEGILLAVLSAPPSDQDIGEDESLRPVCQGAFGAGYPANRLWQAAGLFGDYGLFQSLCTDALSYYLSAIADQLVAPARMTLCPAQKMVHEPLDVSLLRAADSSTSVPLGADGFLYSGETPTCANGAVTLSPAILSGVESIEMRYCVE